MQPCNAVLQLSSVTQCNNTEEEDTETVFFGKKGEEDIMHVVSSLVPFLLSVPGVFVICSMLMFFS